MSKVYNARVVRRLLIFLKWFCLCSSLLTLHLPSASSLAPYLVNFAGASGHLHWCRRTHQGHDGCVRFKNNTDWCVYISAAVCTYVIILTLLWKKLTLLYVFSSPNTRPTTGTACSYDEGKGFVTREVSYVPGLFKIFDEILGTLLVPPPFFFLSSFLPFLPFFSVPWTLWKPKSRRSRAANHRQ